MPELWHGNLSFSLDESIPPRFNSSLMANPLSHIPKTEARAALLSLAVSLILMGVKFGAYFATGSAAIFSDALENIVNVVASAFALYSLSLSHLPADEEHPYGHGKIEFLSAAFEGGMILVAAALIIIEATRSILRGVHLESLGLGMLLSFAAGLINAGVGYLLLRIGRRQSAVALEADGQHLITDAITSFGAVLALIIVYFTGWKNADPIAAMVFAGYIVLIGVRLLFTAGAGLMDRQDERDVRLLRQILDSHVGPAGKEPRICSYHKLRHRHTGRYHWVDFHLVVPANWTIDQGHRIASSIEYEIELALGIGNATAHIEPCTVAVCPHCASYAQMSHIPAVGA